MISEEKLQQYESNLRYDGYLQMCGGPLVKSLIAEVRSLRENLKQETSNLMDALCQTAKHKEVAAQLEREADWLAEQGCDYGCPTQEFAKKCDITNCTIEARIKCWRDAARKAVQD